MRNICITKSNKKLNQNLPYYSSNTIKMFMFNHEQSIYKIYYETNQKIDTILVNSSLITPEIISFIQDLKDNIKTIIYCDNTNIPQINAPVHYIIDNEIKEIDIDGKQLPRFIFNDLIYSSSDVLSPNKLYHMSYFLDTDQQIPEHLSKLLYPNTDLQIRMFNGVNIQHYQHLGYINEKERKDILLESNILLYANEHYLYEASVCGCQVASIQEPENIMNPTDLFTTSDVTTYSSIMKDYIL